MCVRKENARTSNIPMRSEHLLFSNLGYTTRCQCSQCYAAYPCQEAIAKSCAQAACRPMPAKLSYKARGAPDIFKITYPYPTRWQRACHSASQLAMCSHNHRDRAVAAVTNFTVESFNRVFMHVVRNVQLLPRLSSIPTYLPTYVINVETPSHWFSAPQISMQ